MNALPTDKGIGACARCDKEYGSGTRTVRVFNSGEGFAWWCGECFDKYAAAAFPANGPVMVPMWTPCDSQGLRQAPAGKDKSLIWDDCAECAFKHLTAAYAAFTSGEPVTEASEEGVYVARAIIAIHEAESGYTGNLALAAGCLAMAELAYGTSAAIRRDYRTARLGLTAEKPFVDPLLPRPNTMSFVGAHFAEAIRELPAIADRFQQELYFKDGGFSVEDPAAFAELLIGLVRWVETVYELGGTK